MYHYLAPKNDTRNGLVSFGDFDGGVRVYCYHKGKRTLSKLFDIESARNHYREMRRNGWKISNRSYSDYYFAYWKPL